MSPNRSARHYAATNSQFPIYSIDVCLQPVCNLPATLAITSYPLLRNYGKSKQPLGFFLTYVLRVDYCSLDLDARDHCVCAARCYAIPSFRRFIWTVDKDCNNLKFLADGTIFANNSSPTGSGDILTKISSAPSHSFVRNLSYHSFGPKQNHPMPAICYIFSCPNPLLVTCRSSMRSG